MKNPFRYFICIALLYATACNNTENKKEDISKRINDFASLECRAMNLKDKRFALANQLRFTQDTLIHTTNKADTVRLKLRLDSMNAEKEIILQSSLALADSIHDNMEDLLNTFSSKEDKDIFYKMLDSVLIKRSCK